MYLCRAQRSSEPGQCTTTTTTTTKRRCTFAGPSEAVSQVSVLLLLLKGDVPLQGPAKQWARSVPGPGQARPPKLGKGSVQVRSRVLRPSPHSTEHLDHSPHSAQLPSTAQSSLVSHWILTPVNCRTIKLSISKVQILKKRLCNR